MVVYETELRKLRSYEIFSGVWLDRIHLGAEGFTYKKKM
jgi:hypothetical protein